MSMNQRLARVSEIIADHGAQPSQLIAILQDTQTAFNYLSQEDMTLIAQRLGISTAKVYSVATFYENFSLEPKGKHIIRVCDGTACHVRKSQPIYDAIHDYMQLTGKRKTDADGLFTLETVACLGACGLSPVLTIDGEVHAKMTPDSAWPCWNPFVKRRSLPNECSDPRGLPRPAGPGCRRLSAQQVRPDGAYLRRYRLHCQRLHEGL